METVTSCPVCYGRYTKERLPLVLGCGHTFCKVCVGKVPRCPLCRRNVSSTAANLLVLQLTGLPEQVACAHDPKHIFCPLCCFAMCLQCITQHNLHGILPLGDTSVVSTVNDRVRQIRERMEAVNKDMTAGLEQVSLLYQVVESAYENQLDFAKTKFQVLRDALDAREREIIEDIDNVFQPLTSKLLSYTAEFDRCLKANNETVQALEEIMKMKDEERVVKFHPVEVLVAGCRVTEKLTTRVHKLPALFINVERVIDFIRVAGKMEVPLDKKLSFASV